MQVYSVKNQKYRSSGLINHICIYVIDGNAMLVYYVHCSLHNNLNCTLLIRDNTLTISDNILKHTICFNIISINHSLCIVNYISGLYSYPVPLILDK